MNGKVVFEYGIKNMYSAAFAVLDNSGFTVSDIDYVIPHQANTRLINSLASRLGIERSKAWKVAPNSLVLLLSFVDFMYSAAFAALDNNGFTVSDIDYVILHQANTSLINSLVFSLGIERGKAWKVAPNSLVLLLSFVDFMYSAAFTALDNSGFTVSDIDYVIPNQANTRLINS